MKARLLVYTLGAAALGLVLALGASPADAGKKDAKYTIRFGTMAPNGTPWHEALLEWKEKVEKRTNGDVEIELHLGGSLGGELQMIESVQWGTIQAGGFSTGALSSFVPELDLFELPFMWDSRDQCYYILDNYLFEEFDKRFAKKQFKMVAWSENGWRNFFTKVRPVRMPEDLNGLKMRSMENRVHHAFWKSLGANAIPIATPEVYTALQQGTVDGGENSAVLTAATAWDEVIEYYSISQHMYQPAVIVFNMRFWNKLPEAYRKILDEEGRDVAFATRSKLAEAEPEFIEIFKEQGIEVNELTPAERAAFEKATHGVRAKFEKAIGKDLLALVDKAKAEWAKKQAAE